MKTLTTGASVSNAYLNEIARVPLLTPSQEIELGRKVQRAEELRALERPLTPEEQQVVAAGERAERKFVRSNLRLVVNCAKQYHLKTKSMDLMDLVQEGNMGLVTGVRRFDPTKGYRFSTYAYWWIRQSITRAIQSKDRSVRLPGRISDMACMWSSKVNALSAKLGRAPTAAEIAQAFKVSEPDVLLYMERGASPMSLDAVSRETEETTVLDRLTDYVEGEGALEEIARASQVDAAQQALEMLPARERDIVERRMGLGKYPKVQTLHEIGRVHGISRERVRQLFDSSMRRMRLQIVRSELGLEIIGSA